MASPLAWGLYWLALMSVLFEPLRSALYRLGDQVGGVGGVGGLTNQFSPSLNCTSAKNDSHVAEEYCFQSGFLGFTPFAGVTLFLLVVPLGLAALAAHRAGPRLTSDGADGRALDRARRPLLREAAPHGGTVTAFQALWGAASSLWFLVPLAQYASSPYYQEDASSVLLAVSIAAAYPLSWHVGFVAIPSSGAAFLAPLLGCSRATLKACHVKAAWATLFWGSVHAVGELAFLASRGELDLLGFRPTSDIDNLTFIFGLVTFVALIVLAAHARQRHWHRVAGTFRAVHRTLAWALLLCASAHWWPFALFLAPAVAVAATGRAVDVAERRAAPADEDDDADDRGDCSGAPLALAAALSAAVAGIVAAWAARQAWIEAHPRDYYTLSTNAFPPAAVVLAYALARGAAALALGRLERAERKPRAAADEASPLLTSRV